MLAQVSIPENLANGCFHQKLIIRFSADLDRTESMAERITRLLKRCCNPDVRAHIFELADLSMLESLHTLRSTRPGVRLLVADRDLGELHRRRRLVQTVRPVIVLDRCKGSLPRAVQFLASLNLPMQVSPAVFMAQDTESLGGLAERLLFSPFFKTPVQPFFALLQWVLANEPSGGDTLWQVCSEVLGRDYFVTQDGRLSLSRRWAAARRYFGDLFSSKAQIRASSFHQELQTLLDQGVPTSPQCPDCNVAGFCAGFLRALDATQDCAPFISMYEIMAAHAPALKVCLAELPANKQREVAEAIDGPAQPVATGGNTRRAPGPGPTNAMVFVSDRCSNDCIFCAPADKRNHDSIVVNEKIKDFIRQCSAQGIRSLTFSGAGEPAMNPSLADFVATAKSAGIEKTVIITSAAAMSAALLARLKAAGNDALIFSLHGMDSVHDETVQREGAFKELRGSVQAAREMEMAVGFNTCLVNANLSQIAAMLEFGQVHGTMEHTLSFPEWSGNALEYIDRLPSYHQAGQALAKLDWSKYPRVLIDNLPCCFVPSKARCVSPAAMIKYMDLARVRYASTALNFGNNVYPEPCLANKCQWRDTCPGVDKAYLQKYGAAEFSEPWQMRQGARHGI